MGADSIGLALLTPDELRALEKQHPELLLDDEQEGSPHALTISGSPALLSAVRVLVEHIAREQQQSAAVLSALASNPERAVITTERLEQLHRQAESQNAFVDSVELLTSAMIGAWRGSSAKNSSAMASRWKSAGRIFAVPSGRADLYPAFQFDEHGEPRAVIGEVLRHLAAESDWAKALWWTAPSGWLNGRRPVDVLDTDPQSVVEAARHTAEPLEI